MANLYIGNPTRQKRIIQHRNSLGMKNDLVIHAGRQIELNDLSQDEIDSIIVPHEIIPSNQYEPVRGNIIAFVYSIDKPLSESILRGVVEKNDSESEELSDSRMEAAVAQTNILLNETAQAHDKGGKIKKSVTRVSQEDDNSNPVMKKTFVVGDPTGEA